MSTASDIIYAAYAKSSKNQGDRVATLEGETLDALNRCLRLAYAAGARVNPEFFATQADISFATGGWPRPADAESILLLVGAADVLPIDLVGVEIAVVPFLDQEAEPGRPCVYELGQKFYGTGASKPTAGKLTCTYSASPALLATSADNLPTNWPTRFDGLLVADLAMWLAQKDNRQDEVQLLAQELARWQRLFVAFLEHATPLELRRFAIRREYNIKTLFPNVEG